MTVVLRRALAVIAVTGFIVAIAVYVASYVGAASMDRLAHGAILLHFGAIALLLSVYGAEYSAIRNRTFFWKGFAQGSPKWVVHAIKLLGLFCAIHFVTFLIQSHAASPQLKDGKYVLDNHGHVERVLTYAEYVSLKGAELRLFSTGWMFFYAVPLAYWGFHKPPSRADSDLRG